MKILLIIAEVIAAGILLQTLFFKFTGAAESVYIFKTIGAEPVGRIASGIAELIASVRLFIPRFTWLGASLALGVMAGAIVCHLIVLGVVIWGDGGELFALACVVFVFSAFILWCHRGDLPIIGKRLKHKA